jgi:hypothetical protein
VYATTEGKQGQRTDINFGENSPKLLSFTGLASKGIVGLRDRHHVAAYHKFWADAVTEEVAEPVEPDII